MENKEKMETTELETEEVQEEKIDVMKGIETLESRLIESEKKLAETQAELENTKGTFQRTLAEYDNYRKRTAKEKAETYNNGMINAVTNILPVLDTLEMALNAPCSDENYKKGIELTLTTAKNALSNMGITEIDALDKEFDPNLHNAVMQESVDGVDAGICTKQFQKGYKLGERVIRHATVAVSC